MEFPKRTDSHVTESASWKILQKSLPEEWVIREVTERDYGIDCYVEIVQKDRQVTGDLCSIQLKGTDGIEWSKDANGQHSRARFSGIKKTTINYWMNLPVPVFLMWADIAKGKLFFSPVKAQVRRQYIAYLDQKQKTLGFDFFSDLDMETPTGKLAFFACYVKEKYFSQFSNYLRGVLIHCREYWNFIVANQGRDCFMEVEEGRQLILVHIYNSCLFLSDFLDVKWNVIGLDEAFEEDRETWKNTYCLLHEMTLDKVLRELEPVFIEILKKAKNLVSNLQQDYWTNEDPLLFTMCLNLDVDHLYTEY